MKNNILLLFALLLILASCQKQPTANFNSDKTSYTAGDIIHLTDASQDAHSWKWTAPNGNIYTTQNLDYPLDSDDLGGSKTFTLEVASKNGKKTASISKAIKVNQYILSSDFCSGIYKIEFKYNNVENGYWLLNAGRNYTSAGKYSGTEQVTIYFGNGTAKPPIGTYQLVTDKSLLTAGKAFINYYGGDVEVGFNNYNSLSGQIIVTQAYKGRITVSFNNVQTTGGAFSANITSR